jgi:hypothetical protein
MPAEGTPRSTSRISVHAGNTASPFGLLLPQAVCLLRRCRDCPHGWRKAS